MAQNGTINLYNNISNNVQRKSIQYSLFNFSNSIRWERWVDDICTKSAVASSNSIQQTWPNKTRDENMYNRVIEGVRRNGFFFGLKLIMVLVYIGTHRISKNLIY